MQATAAEHADGCSECTASVWTRKLLKSCDRAVGRKLEHMMTELDDDAKILHVWGT